MSEIEKNQFQNNEKSFNETPLKAAKEVPINDVQVTKKPLAQKKELGLGKKLQTVSFAMSALSYVPSEQRQKIINGLLERAGIPSGPYEYSLELRELLINDSKALEKDLARYERIESKDKREEVLQRIIERMETSTENLIQKFILDNTPDEKREEKRKIYQTKRVERIKDTYKLDLLTAQMKIALAFARSDDSAAMIAAKEYVANSYLGLESAAVKLDEKTEKILSSFAKSLLAQTREHVMPILEQKVLEFAKKTFHQSFWNRAKQTGSFAWDWVTTPFNKDSKDRMAKSMTPMIEMGTTGLMKIAPIVSDFVKTGFQISMNNKEALALLVSVAGAVSFDLALMAGTWGVGAALKGPQIAGMAVRTGMPVARGFAAASLGFSAGKTMLRPAHGLSDKLSFAKLEEAVHEKVVRDARKEG